MAHIPISCNVEGQENSISKWKNLKKVLMLPVITATYICI